jgi:hypothetical protein
LALVASANTVATSMDPVSGVSLSCSKTGILALDGGLSSLQCDDSIVHVLGVWPLVQLGLLLAIPPVMAALLMRRRVSWLVVSAFVGLTSVAVAHWSSFWVSLWFAAPMAVVGLVAAVQHVLQPECSPNSF